MFSTLLVFINTHRKILAIAGIALSLFVAGWQVNGWRLNAKIEKERAELREAFDARRTELLAQFEKRALEDAERSVALSSELTQSREAAKGLREQLRAARLTKPEEKIRVERITEFVPSEGGVRTVIANPFSDEFVRLWNDSARSGSADTD